LIFHQLPLGKTEKTVSIEVTVNERIGPAYDFLEVNQIPGKTVFYELVKTVLSRYYAVEYHDSVAKLFKESYAYAATAELYDSASHRHFDELPHHGLRDIYQTKILKRRRAIKKYAKTGPPFPCPLYIQEKILENIIDKSSGDADIIMVDGARRIIAGCLCRLRTMDVVLITKKKLKG